MSEGLLSKYTKNGDIVGQLFGDFEYFNIGDVTFKQLASAKIIPTSFNKKYTAKKPDRVIVSRHNKKAPQVIAVVEDKDLGKFSSESEREKAIQQCNNYCQEVRAKIGIISDGTETIWINPQQKSKETEYIDKTTKEKRSYTIIRKDDESLVTVPFELQESSDILEVDDMSDSARGIYKLVKEIASKTNSKNSVIRQPGRIDPLPLARSVWQGIWVATGKTPEKCLYNVVELFIFKFLSDLEIITDPYDFSTVYDFVEKGKDPNEVLTYYVDNSRKAIYKKFPAGADGTSIINGTIFVNEQGKANLNQAVLFRDTLKKFKDFEEKYGKFSTHNIDKEFKTKLYESFLKQTAGSKAMGQFFTPRRVVRAVIEMSGIRDFRGGERVADPFCGVGGFLLEPLNLPERSRDFEPRGGKINSPVTYIGYDKGSEEKDDDRTIILAKANMLIYLSELIAENSRNLTEEFARNAFNKTFTLIRSNLGTLGKVTNKEEEKFDLILTNPPYVKKGIGALKNEISEDPKLYNFYTANGGGLEGLALEWIIRHLKKGGRALVVIPDGILHRNEDKRLRKFVFEECYVEALISLPQKTFYATTKKTYVLSIVRKQSSGDVQEHPIFTYLASSIGETLDSNRFDTPDDNDLNEMVLLFNQFKNNKANAKIKQTLESQSKRCKLFGVDDFDLEAPHWLIDRWWSKEEKVALGVEEEDDLLSSDEFLTQLRDTQEFLKETLTTMTESISKLEDGAKFEEFELQEIADLAGGNSEFTKKYANENQGKYPLYTAKTEDEGLVGYISSFGFNEECLTYTTNGVHAGTVFYRPKHKFSLNGDAAQLILKPEYSGKIDYQYLFFAVQEGFKREGLGWEYKASQGKVKKALIRIPIDEKGELSLDKQKSFAETYKRLEETRNEIEEKIDLLIEPKVSLG